jgi:hypothetical protein
MASIARQLANSGFSLATVYMLDVNFISDDSKYISGILMFFLLYDFFLRAIAS